MVDILLYVSLIALVILTVLSSRQKLDLLRHELFCLRYKLFNLALENNGLNFDDSIYRDMERVINSSIRFAHLIGFESFAVYLTVKVKKIDLDEKRDIYPVLDESIDPETKEKLKKIVEQHEEILNDYISDKFLPILLAVFLLILLLLMPVLVILLPFIVLMNIVPKTRSIVLRIKSVWLKLRQTPSDMEKVLYATNSDRNVKLV